MKQAFLTQAVQAAVAAEHPFPIITACEAAFETDFGDSPLATYANNLFQLTPTAEYGFMYPRAKLYIDTFDYKRGVPVLSRSYWPVFPSYEVCMRERLAYLKHRALYDAGITEAMRLAEAQKTSVTDLSVDYIIHLSKNIYGPKDRADRVLAIRAEHDDVLQTLYTHPVDATTL